MATQEIIEKAVRWAIKTSKDPKSGYNRDDRYGPDYDCSSLITTAWNRAGVPVQIKDTRTANMRKRYLAVGFKNVTKKVNLDTGEGLVRGDVLVHEGTHTAMYVGNGKMVHARGDERGGVRGGKPGDQTGGEIKVTKYSNMHWNLVLRYVEDDLEARYRINVGIYSSLERAEKIVDKIARKTGLDAKVKFDGKVYHVRIVDKYNTQMDAQMVANVLSDANFIPIIEAI